MKKTICLILLTALTISPALAQNATSPVTASGTSVLRTKTSLTKGLTLQQAIDVRAALLALDNYQAQDKDGRAIALPYKFSGPTRMAIARNLARANEAYQALQTANNALVAQFSGGAQQVPADKMSAYTTEINKVLQGPADVGAMVKISEADLDLATNPIPGSVLAALVPILEAKP